MTTEEFVENIYSDKTTIYSPTAGCSKDMLMSIFMKNPKRIIE